jgi:histidinol-phosphate aminotransferase
MRLEPVQSVDEPHAESAVKPAPVKWLDQLAPYDPVSSLKKIWDRPGQEPLKLDWNESTIPPSPKVYQSIVSFLSHSNHLNWYPELGSANLCEAIADYVSLVPGNVMVTNGSDDALELICKTYLGPGDRVVAPIPTYTHFLVYVQARGAELAFFEPADIFSPEIDGLMGFITPETRLVYLVSPNNPTGVTYSQAEVERLLKAFPGTMFIVDEAYHEFHGESVVGLVSRYDNLVVTRTFSKCFGIAGLRMGYLCTSEPVMVQLRKLFNPKSVNRLGQIAAMACLSDLDYYGRFVDEVTRAKRFFRDEMARRGFDVKTTPANFVLLQVEDPKAFCLALEEQGVYVRDRSSLARLHNYIRISIPTVVQTEDLLCRIDRALESLRS